MKKIITVLIVAIVAVVMQSISVLPWWTFLIPVFILGIALPLEKWKVLPFVWGGIAGAAVWIVSTIYFEMKFEGSIVENIALILELPALLIYPIIGIIGGTLNGLALYSGYLLRKGREELKLDLS